MFLFLRRKETFIFLSESWDFEALRTRFRSLFYVTVFSNEYVYCKQQFPNCILHLWFSSWDERRIILDMKFPSTTNSRLRPLNGSGSKRENFPCSFFSCLFHLFFDLFRFRFRSAWMGLYRIKFVTQLKPDFAVNSSLQLILLSESLGRSACIVFRLEHVTQIDWLIVYFVSWLSLCQHLHWFY